MNNSKATESNARSLLLKALQALILIVPLLLLWDFKDAGKVAEDFYYVENSCDFRPSEQFSSEWEMYPVPGVSSYRPLTKISYYLDCQLSGPDLSHFRVSNYLLHGLASLLLSIFLYRITGSREIALAGGLLFAVHPIHHANTVWISGRTHALASVFVLTALISALSFFRGKKIFLSALGIFAFGLLGILSYESAIMLPFLTGILWLLIRKSDSKPELKYLIFSQALSWAPVFLYLVMKHSALSEQSSISFVGIANNLSHFLILFIYSIGLPDRTLLLEERFISWAIVLGIVIWSIATSLRQKNSLRLLLTGFALSIVSFLPFLSSPSFADRYGYFAVIAVVFALSAPLYSSRRISRVFSCVLCCIVFIVWSWQLRQLGQEWEEAGRIAEKILIETDKLSPDLPENSILLLENIPAIHGQAYVFPHSLEAIIQKRLNRPDLSVHNTNRDGPASEAVNLRGKWDPVTETIQLTANEK